MSTNGDFSDALPTKVPTIWKNEERRGRGDAVTDWIYWLLRQDSNLQPSG